MKCGNLILSYVVANSSLIPKLGSELHPQGLEEVLVVHQLDPDDL